ncbi:MAG TPA: hypothetical protein VKE94_01825, partial [Gemmataceae bacterium]|nr:hypothetical protein [Gemmataceae bacterium]
SVDGLHEFIRRAIVPLPLGQACGESPLVWPFLLFARFRRWQPGDPGEMFQLRHAACHASKRKQ